MINNGSFKFSPVDVARFDRFITVHQSLFVFTFSGGGVKGATPISSQSDDYLDAAIAT